ncbi:CHASE domain-containing protein [Mesorhizobium sp. L-8-3]|uniref:CHASE domain-containing protein n=1 Tax=Mesorhizobium sp. L-8-3 TaxID=2744522 RepID=UPI00192937DC|nr:CHASE domain-containing protein [Mesorhizobium sp. L-8-3]
MRRFLPAAAFLSVALASLVMAGYAYFAVHEAARIKFEGTADEALNRIEGRLEIHLALLDATHALFQARDGQVSRMAFKTFFDALDVEKSFTGLRGIGFLRLVKTGDEAVVVRDMERDHGRILPIQPDTDQAWRTPVTLFQPRENIAGIGYDMFTDPARRAAIEKAMGDEGTWATGLVQIGEAMGGPGVPGFLVFKRLNVGSAPSGTAPPGAATIGLLFASFRSAELFNSALGRAPLLPVAAEIFVGTPEDGNLLFRTEAPPGTVHGADLPVTRQTVVGGRQWTVVFRPTSAFEPPTSLAVPLMLGTFGLLLATAIAAAARLQAKAYEAARALQQATEKSLLEKDMMLQEMKHRIKNSITRIMAIARQTAAGASDIGQFTTTFGARLQAMAASQDVLTRARWQKADLVDLLTIELGLAFGNELPPGLMSGPSVRLDEATTQALGLTFHELATNTLKYADVSGLRVTWEVLRNGRNRHLHLRWSESGVPDVSEPERTGFGTKLIDMTITRELHGTIQRHYRPDGLQIEIAVPLGKAKS